MRIFLLQMCFILLCELHEAHSFVELKPPDENVSGANTLDSINKPEFGHRSYHTNVSIRKGSDAFLHCKVSGLGEQSVSWYKPRNEEIQLITFGVQTYHNDARFSLSLSQPDDWQLRIRNVHRKDAGIYECQVSTHPPLIRTVNLSVVVPTIGLFDDRSMPLKEKFYKPGSTIILLCSVTDVPTSETLQVMWYHGTKRLNYDAPRGGVSVKTEIRGSTAKSWLRVAQAVTDDSGVYYCNVTGLPPVPGNVHIVQDKYPAAMQGASQHHLDFTTLIFYLLLVNTNLWGIAELFR